MKYAVVTGSNAGVGKATARALLRQGYFVTLACRTESKARVAVEELERIPDARGRVQFLRLDLASFDSIRDFVEAYKLPLNLLVNNAGVGGVKPQIPELSEDGLELIFQSNFLGHFYLTLLLLPVLKKSAPARVVNLASATHWFGSLDWKSHSKKRTVHNYASSKLAMVIFAYEINRRWFKYGITAVAVNPGAVDSEIWSRDSWHHRALIIPLQKSLFLSIDQGCSTTIVGAECDVSGPNNLVYLSPYGPLFCGWLRDFFGIYVGSSQLKSLAVSYSEIEAQRLWSCSQDILKEKGFLVDL